MMGQNPISGLCGDLFPELRVRGNVEFDYRASPQAHTHFLETFSMMIEPVTSGFHLPS